MKQDLGAKKQKVTYTKAPQKAEAPITPRKKPPKKPPTQVGESASKIGKGLSTLADELDKQFDIKGFFKKVTGGSKKYRNFKAMAVDAEKLKQRGDTKQLAHLENVIKKAWDHYFGGQKKARQKLYGQN